MENLACHGSPWNHCQMRSLPIAVHDAVQQAIEENVQFDVRANVYTLVAVTGVILFWRGVWNTWGEPVAEQVALQLVQPCRPAYGFRCMHGHDRLLCSAALQIYGAGLEAIPERRAQQAFRTSARFTPSNRSCTADVFFGADSLLSNVGSLVVGLVVMLLVRFWDLPLVTSLPGG